MNATSDNNPTSYAFVFPGQGSQQVGMGKDLAERYPAARAIFAEADDALGFALSDLCFRGDEAELALTANTQPAILTTSIAALAAARVELEWSWDAKRIWIRIADDGPGFAPEILARIGEPYTSKRHLGDRSTGGGLGLGMFIAKTLLERSGASLVFSNDPEGNGGAQVMVSWLRSSVEMQPQEATI